MKFVAAAIAGVLFASLPGAALAQATGGEVTRRDSPASLRCSALGSLPEADRGAAVHYLAGYNDGERDAISFATVTTGPAGEDGAAARPSSPLPVTPGGPPAAILPAVAVDAVLAACAQSPDSRVVDIITAQGARGN